MYSSKWATKRGVLIVVIVVVIVVDVIGVVVV